MLQDPVQSLPEVRAGTNHFTLPQKDVAWSNLATPFLGLALLQALLRNVLFLKIRHSTHIKYTPGSTFTPSTEELHSCSPQSQMRESPKPPQGLISPVRYYLHEPEALPSCWQLQTPITSGAELLKPV